MKTSQLILAILFPLGTDCFRSGHVTSLWSVKLYWKVSGRLREGYSSLIKKEREGQEDMSSSPLPVLSFPALDILCDDVFFGAVAATLESWGWSPTTKAGGA